MTRTEKENLVPVWERITISCLFRCDTVIGLTLNAIACKM